LLKLRNPWGHKEWMGDWSDKSSKWTDDLRKQLNFVDADDGVFYISYQDYMCYYRSTTICKVHDNFFHQSIRIDSKTKPMAGYPVPAGVRPYHLIKINLKEKAKLFATVV